MTVTVSLELLLTLLLGIGGIAVAWGIMRATVASFEKRINALESRIDDHDDMLKAVTRLEEQFKAVKDELHRISAVFDRLRYAGAKAT
jgi:Tfp pilus assembly protein PilN